MRKQEIIVNGWGEYWDLLPPQHQEYALANNGFVCIRIGNFEIWETLEVWKKYHKINTEITSMSITNTDKKVCIFVMPGIIYKKLKEHHPNNNFGISKEFKY